MELEEFFYFDEIGLDMLFNQIGEGRLESYTAESNKGQENNANLKPKLGISSFLKMVGGISGDIEGGIEHKRLKSEKRSQNFSKTRESRYKDIIDFLGGLKNMKKSLDQAWLKSLEKGSAFCVLEGYFRPAYEVDDWYRICDEAKFLQLESKNQPEFKVGMSYEKLIGLRRNTLNGAGHLAIRLRNGSEMRIFGKIDKTKYIKPYSASWM